MILAWFGTFGLADELLLRKRSDALARIGSQIFMRNVSKPVKERF